MEFNDFWINKSGKKEQLKNVKHGVRKEQLDAKFHNIFDAYDRNNNGFLEQDEIEGIFDNLVNFSGEDKVLDDSENKAVGSLFSEVLDIKDADFAGFMQALSKASLQVRFTDETSLEDGSKRVKVTYADGRTITSEYYPDGTWKSNKLEVDPRRFVVFKTDSGITLKVNYYKRKKSEKSDQTEVFTK